MANMSNYLENKLIDFLLRGVSFTPPTNLYIALCTSSVSDASTGSNIPEVAGGNYTRQSIASNSSNWSTTNADNSSVSSGTGGTTTNNALSITWTNVSWSGTVTHMAICDAMTGGNVLFFGSLDSAKTIASGDSVSFGINTINIQIDN
jgi:hypothetical protein